MGNYVYIAASLDGYIADRNNGLDWLHSIPNPEKKDFGFNNFVASIDAIIMGRKTFETVCSFDCTWPYSKPVFVLSNTLKSAPKGYKDKIKIVSGDLKNVLEELNKEGYNNLYIDGGVTIQSFLKEGLIDEITITTIPILLGGGIPLFGKLPNEIKLEHVKTEVFLNAIVQTSYKIKK